MQKCVKSQSGRGTDVSIVSAMFGFGKYDDVCIGYGQIKKLHVKALEHFHITWMKTGGKKSVSHPVSHYNIHSIKWLTTLWGTGRGRGGTHFVFNKQKKHLHLAMTNLAQLILLVK